MTRSPSPRSGVAARRRQERASEFRLSQWLQKQRWDKRWKTSRNHERCNTDTGSGLIRNQCTPGAVGELSEESAYRESRILTYLSLNRVRQFRTACWVQAVREKNFMMSGKKSPPRPSASKKAGKKLSEDSSAEQRSSDDESLISVGQLSPPKCFEAKEKDKVLEHDFSQLGALSQEKVGQNSEHLTLRGLDGTPGSTEPHRGPQRNPLSFAGRGTALARCRENQTIRVGLRSQHGLGKTTCVSPAVPVLPPSAEDLQNGPAHRTVAPPSAEDPHIGSAAGYNSAMRAVSQLGAAATAADTSNDKDQKVKPAKSGQAPGRSGTTRRDLAPTTRRLNSPPNHVTTAYDLSVSSGSIPQSCMKRMVVARPHGPNEPVPAPRHARVMGSTEANRQQTKFNRLLELVRRKEKGDDPIATAELAVLMQQDPPLSSESQPIYIDNSSEDDLPDLETDAQSEVREDERGLTLKLAIEHEIEQEDPVPDPKPEVTLAGSVQSKSPPRDKTLPEPDSADPVEKTDSEHEDSDINDDNLGTASSSRPSRTRARTHHVSLPGAATSVFPRDTKARFFRYDSCPACGIEVKGTTQVLRHYMNCQMHQYYYCPEEDCDAMFSRSDPLDKHLKVKHQWFNHDRHGLERCAQTVHPDAQGLAQLGPSDEALRGRNRSIRAAEHLELHHQRVIPLGALRQNNNFHHSEVEAARNFRRNIPHKVQADGNRTGNRWTRPQSQGAKASRNSLSRGPAGQSAMGGSSSPRRRPLSTPVKRKNSPTKSPSSQKLTPNTRGKYQSGNKRIKPLGSDTNVEGPEATAVNTTPPSARAQSADLPSSTRPYRQPTGPRFADEQVQARKQEMQKAREAYRDHCTPALLQGQMDAGGHVTWEDQETSSRGVDPRRGPIPPLARGNQPINPYQQAPTQRSGPAYVRGRGKVPTDRQREEQRVGGPPAYDNGRGRSNSRGHMRGNLMGFNPMGRPMPPRPDPNTQRGRSFSYGPYAEMAPQIGPQFQQYQDQPGYQEFYSNENFLPLGQGTRILRDEIEQGRPSREQAERNRAFSQEAAARDHEQMQTDNPEDTGNWDDRVHSAPWAHGMAMYDPRFVPTYIPPPPLPICGPRQARQVNVPLRDVSLTRPRAKAPVAQSRLPDSEERTDGPAAVSKASKFRQTPDYDTDGHDELSITTTEESKPVRAKSERGAGTARGERPAKTKTRSTELVSVTPANPISARRSPSDVTMALPPGSVIVVYPPAHDGTINLTQSTLSGFSMFRLQAGQGASVTGTMLAPEPVPSCVASVTPRPARRARNPREDLTPREDLSCLLRGLLPLHQLCC
jgi:hypothetical protein